MVGAWETVVDLLLRVRWEVVDIIVKNRQSLAREASCQADSQ